MSTLALFCLAAALTTATLSWGTHQGLMRIARPSMYALSAMALVLGLIVWLT